MTDTKAKIAEQIRELKAFAAWVEAMPAVPGHHRNGDALFETIQNVMEDAMQWQHDELVRAWEGQGFDEDAESEEECDDTSPAFWDRIAEKLGVDLEETENDE